MSYRTCASGQSTVSASRWRRVAARASMPTTRQVHPNDPCCGSAHHSKVEFWVDSTLTAHVLLTVDATPVYTQAVDWLGDQAQYLTETHSEYDTNYGGYLYQALVGNVQACTTGYGCLTPYLTPVSAAASEPWLAFGFVDGTQSS